MEDRSHTDGVERALVVTAHPDDLDFEAGATIASWTAAGVAVAVVLVTSGDAGQSSSAPREEVIALREAETIAAAAELGVDDVTFFRYPDSRVEVTLDLRRDIARQIRRVRPQRVVTWAPERTYDIFDANHPDHRAVGEATLCAAYPDGANRFIHPELTAEGWEAWHTPETWLMSAPRPNAYVDVTDTIEAKLRALRAHASQTGRMDELEGSIRQRAANDAAAAGTPPGRLAETFLITRTSA